MMQHTKPALNVVKRPFEPDERGRQKSTEILDHIIKEKRNRNKNLSSTFDKIKVDEQSTFI